MAIFWEALEDSFRLLPHQILETLKCAGEFLSSSFFPYGKQAVNRSSTHLLGLAFCKMTNWETLHRLACTLQCPISDVAPEIFFKKRDIEKRRFFQYWCQSLFILLPTESIAIRSLPKEGNKVPLLKVVTTELVEVVTAVTSKRRLARFWAFSTADMVGSFSERLNSSENLDGLGWWGMRNRRKRRRGKRIQKRREGTYRSQIGIFGDLS